MNLYEKLYFSIVFRRKRAYWRENRSSVTLVPSFGIVRNAPMQGWRRPPPPHPLRAEASLDEWRWPPRACASGPSPAPPGLVFHNGDVVGRRHRMGKGAALTQRGDGFGSVAERTVPYRSCASRCARQSGWRVPGLPRSRRSHARVPRAIASTESGVGLNARVSRSRSAASTELRTRPAAAASSS